ncbi:MAG: DNA polymerase Y family protein [Xanthobacteraceae bacterium]
MSTPSSPRRYLSIWLRRLATDRLTRCFARRPDEAAGPDAPAGGSEPDEAPLVVAHKVKSALRIAALNDAAARLGLTVELALADACARHPGLAIAPADPEADQRLLEAVADWCDRYTPLVARDAPTGLMLDISGCAHLFGGETALANDIVSRLAAQGLRARVGVAATPGCAWAVARYGVRELTSLLEGEVDQDQRAGLDREGGSFNPSLQSLTPLPIPPPQGGREHVPRGEMEENVFIVPAAATGETLAPLPLAALRLAPDTVAALADVGLHRVADVLDLPRATLAARFGDDFLLRLDQALGRVEEPITPRLPAPSFMAEQHFAEPIGRERDVLGTISRLSIRLGYAMEARGEGARRLELALFRSDGKVHRLAVGTSAPVRAADQIGRLFKDRLASLAESCDPGFGYDLVRLSAPVTERLAPVQADFAAEDLAASDQAESLAHLIDRLGTRLGLRRVTRLVPRDTHIPEFAVAAVPAHAVRPLPQPVFTSPRLRGEVGSLCDPSEGALPRFASPPHPARRFASRHPLPAGGERGSMAGKLLGQDTLAPVRPVRLFARPEPIEAIAEVPDGPPARFRWRRVLHEVAAAEGPERIALEWWRDEEGHALTRDYFRVESRAGARVWLFREGLYGREAATPRWFLHGLFG